MTSIIRPPLKGARPSATKARERVDAPPPKAAPKDGLQRQATVEEKKRGTEKPKTGLEALLDPIVNIVQNAFHVLGGAKVEAPAPSNSKTDGKIHDVITKNASPPVYFVNGASTTLTGAHDAAKAVADASARNVKLIHNDTALAGPDFKEVNQDVDTALALRGAADAAAISKANSQLSPSAQTVRDLALEAMHNGASIDFAGHSAGTAAVTAGLQAARALRTQELTREFARDDLFKGTAGEDAAKRVASEMGRIRFVAGGSAVKSEWLPEGVAVTFANNPGDRVPDLAQKLERPGDTSNLEILQAIFASGLNHEPGMEFRNHRDSITRALRLK